MTYIVVGESLSLLHINDLQSDRRRLQLWVPVEIQGGRAANDMPPWAPWDGVPNSLPGELIIICQYSVNATQGYHQTSS